MSIELNTYATYQKLFGLKIKQLREHKNMSQLDLASLCNRDKTSISRIENGRTNITLKTAVMLSIHLDVELNELFDFKLIK